MVKKRRLRQVIKKSVAVPNLLAGTPANSSGMGPDEDIDNSMSGGSPETGVLYGGNPITAPAQTNPLRTLLARRKRRKRR